MFELMFSPVVVVPPVKGPETVIDESMLEDLDFAPPCEIQHVVVMLAFGVLPTQVPMEPPCKKEARWVLSCRGCAHPTLACDDHLSWVMRQPNVACPRCGLPGSGGVVYRFAPLEP